jgi:hypothetical protein
VKRRFLLVGGGLTLAALSALAGRLTAPERPARVDVREVERVVYRDKVVTFTQREAAQRRDVAVYRDRVTTPDGTVREREVERAMSTASEREHAAQAITRDMVRDVERRVEVRAPSPTWRVSLLAGAAVRLTPTPVVGLHIQRRLWGPVSAGAWTLAPIRGGAPVTAGVSLSLEF